MTKKIFLSESEFRILVSTSDLFDCDKLFKEYDKIEISEYDQVSGNYKGRDNSSNFLKWVPGIYASAKELIEFGRS